VLVAWRRFLFFRVWLGLCRYRDGFLYVGSRTDNRDTFATKTIHGFRPSGQPIGCSNSFQTNLCTAKEKYPKERPPHAACFLRSSGLSGVFRRGFPAPAKNAMHPCIAPNGQIRSNPPVLGAAPGENHPEL